MTANQLTHQRMLEEQRHNSASEKETYRHNYVTEQLTQFANRMRERELEIQDWYNRNMISHYATQDANSEYANITNRLAMQENARHNAKVEALNKQSIILEKMKTDEAERHNKATEDISTAINASQMMVNTSIINYNKARTATEAYQQKKLKAGAFHDYASGGSQIVNALFNAINGAADSALNLIKFVK